MHGRMDGTEGFRWGIVGTGGIARQFADDLAHVPGARLAAVCSRSRDSAERFVAGAERVRIHTGLDDLLGDPAVDAVYIATPNHLHAAQALQAVQAGKPTLVEKPVATTSADAAALFEAACGVFVMEAMWSRFLPAVAEARRLIAEGAIGTPERVEAELAYARNPQRDARFFDAAAGGGAALDLGVYPLSLAMFLFGEPDAVSGRWVRGPGGVDLRCAFTLAFGGVRAALACGIDRDGANAFTVFGSAGALRLHAPFLKAQRLTLYSKAAAGLPLVGAGRSLPGLPGKVLARMPVPGRRIMEFPFPGNGLQFEAKAVMEAVRRGETVSPVSPPAHSLEVLRVIETVLSGSAAS